MSKEALSMRGPVHGTKDAKRVAIGSGIVPSEYLDVKRFQVERIPARSCQNQSLARK